MHWRLHLALVDALLGKEIQVSSRLRIYPQVGLRYAIIRQKFNLDNMFLALAEETVRMKNKFWGIGPCGSLGLQWIFVPPFSLLAKGGLSSPYGQFYLHQDTSAFRLRDTFSRVAVIAEASIAFCWRKAWEKRALSLYIGWDYMLFFQQNRLVRFFEAAPLDSGPGSLGLKGWEWGAQFAF